MKPLKGIVESLLFVADKPLSPQKLAEIAEVEPREINEILKGLLDENQDENRGFLLRKVAGGYRFYAQPRYHSFVEKLVSATVSKRASRAALETLAIIAYKQPITKGEIKAIRGVSPEAALNSLLEKELIKETGRKDAPGQPILYGTAPKFLGVFGLKNIRDLPPLEKFAPEKETKKVIEGKLTREGEFQQ